MRKTVKTLAAVSVVAGAACGQVVAATMFAPQAAVQSTAVIDPATDDVSLILARRICDRVRMLGTDSDATRFEAEMVYALSQSGDDVATQIAALRTVRTLCLTPGSMEVALANADASINNGGTAGTAATAASLGQGGFDAGSAFSSPAIDLGGGSVNYSL